MDADLFDNPVNPFSLMGARCRLRSPSARKSPLRSTVHKTDTTHFNEHALGLTFRHAKGSATIDPDEFFAEIGVTDPKFSETGRKMIMLQKPTPVSTVLQPKQRRPGSATASSPVPGKNKARAISEQAQQRNADVLKTTKAIQDTFLTEPDLDLLLPEQRAVLEKKMEKAGGATCSEGRLINTLIKQSSEKLEALSANLLTPTAKKGTTREASKEQQQQQQRPGSPAAVSTPSRRLQAVAYKDSLREDVRKRFSAAQTLKQMAQIRADENKLRERDKQQFEAAIFTEQTEKAAYEREVSVLQAKLEAASHEIASLRNALFLLTRKHEIEHHRLVQLELESQKYKDSLPLLRLLGEQFAHTPPEEILAKLDVLESALLQAFSKAQGAAEALNATEDKLMQERIEHGNNLQKVSETMSVPIQTLENRVNTLTAANEKLMDDIHILKGSQEKYLALSFAVAELWSQWIDPKTHSGGVAKLVGKKADGLHPNLSHPMEVLRCIGNLLSICYPQIEASSIAFRKVATLANRAWSRILSTDDTECLLKYDICAILEECCNRAENGHKTELYLKGIIKRLEIENKRLTSELGKTEQRCKQLGNLTRSAVTPRPASGHR